MHENPLMQEIGAAADKYPGQWIKFTCLVRQHKGILHIADPVALLVKPTLTKGDTNGR